MNVGKFLWAILFLLVGLGLSLALGRFLYQEESKAIELGFRSDIDQLSAVFEREVLLNLEILFALRESVSVLPDMDSERFRVLTQKLLERSPAIQAFAWAPVVRHEDLSGFVGLQREQFVNFALKEAVGTGLRAAQERPWYVPVQFIEPLSENRAALGYDLASEGSRLAALLAARETGTMAATAGIRLVQEPENQKGFLVFAPLYRPASSGRGLGDGMEHYGFINGVFRVGELVHQAIGDELGDDFLFQVYDRSGDENVLLFSSSDPKRADWDAEGRYRSAIFDIGGRQWVVEAVPSKTFIERRRGRLPVFVAGSGVLFAGLLFSYLLVSDRRAAELSAAKTELERISLTDSLTGLANRRHFDAVLEAEYRRAIRQGTALSLIMLDIDHFKEYNDLYGHPKGDACLALVADALIGVVHRPADLVARYGGEEFAIILPDTPDASEVADACRLAVEALGIAHETSGAAKVVTISVGTAVLTPETWQQNSTDLLNRADDALYQAKETGRNRVCSA